MIHSSGNHLWEPKHITKFMKAVKEIPTYAESDRKEDKTLSMTEERKKTNKLYTAKRTVYRGIFKRKKTHRYDSCEPSVKNQEL